MRNIAPIPIFLENLTGNMIGAYPSVSLSPPLHIYTQNQDYRPTEQMAFDLEKIGSGDNFLNLF